MFSYRSSDAIGFADLNTSTTADIYAVPKDAASSTGGSASKTSGFSPNGRLFAWLTIEGINVMDVDTRSVVNVPVKKPIEFSFSPQGTYISTFERLLKTTDGSMHSNANIWTTENGQLWHSFSHKNPETWRVQWTQDESYFARLVTNQVQFHDRRNPGGVASKLALEGIAGFSISPGKNPSVAAFVPERKGSPAIVRLYGLLSFNYPLSNKSFFKADEVEFNWNPIGTNVLVLTRTATDKTGQSYYGETNLYYLSAVGNYDCRVTLDAAGPVHEIAWGPLGNEFVVVYGNVPAKAALFDSRANKVFDFGSSAKNFVRYSPKGRLILMAGFGNLAGHVEIWDRKSLIKLSEYKEDLAVFCEFAPDGTKILTATLSPRLRVDNRFRIRNYKGEILWQKEFKELFSVAIRPQVLENSPEEIELFEVVEAPKQDVKKTGAYVPPHLRGSAGSSNGSSNNTLTTFSAKYANNNDSTTKPKQPRQQQQQTKPESADDKQKKVNALNRKLRQITQLKERQKNGEELEKNQLDKIESEPDLLKELKELSSELK